jgi:hypothetical protein
MHNVRKGSMATACTRLCFQHKVETDGMADLFDFEDLNSELAADGSRAT